MENPIKNILARNSEDGSEVSYTRYGFSNLKENPRNSKWVSVGYVAPPDTMPCWYVDELEKNKAIKNQKPFSEFFSPHEYFKVSKRIDNIFIEGYLGRYDQEITFLDSFNQNLTYMMAYQSRKKIHFTFDKISLFQVMEILPENPLKFILKRLDILKSFKKDQAFMIMPFHNPLLDIFYSNNVKSYLKEKLSIDIYRADDFRDNDIIVQTIYNLIEESEFVIADTTFENKNSFYELGYASAVGKEIITIQDKTTEQKLFFDRAHIRSIFYDPKDLNSFFFDLESTIKSIRSRN